jgi:hypothetical protein
MTALNMAKHRNNLNFAFWKMIKEGYDHFEATHQEPKVTVCEKRYVFDAAEPPNSSKSLAFDARGVCPMFQLDPSIADAVLDRRRQEQQQMVQYIARDIAVVPSRNGIDGGMNPVFAAKLGIDNNGQVYLAADNTTVPGALPRASNPSTTTVVTPQAPQTSQPVVMANAPQPALQPNKGEARQPTSIAGLFGNLFSGSEARAQQSVGVALTNGEMVVKPERAAPLRTASAPTVPHLKPHGAPPKPDAVAAVPPVQQARDDQKTPAPTPDLRTAYSAPPPSDSGLLTGAQPVVPTSSFESRWTALR